MKSITFAKRNFKEIVRDPISLFFCIGFPVLLLIIFQQFKIPNEVYQIQNFAPSIIVFSFAFLSLFAGQLIAKDRSTSFLTRLFSSPLKISDYLIGYSISLLPLALLQSLIFIIVGSFFGLNITINILYTIFFSLIVSLLFIGIGILIGCIFNERQAPGLGSIIVQLVAFTSGMWFSIDIIGGFFKTLCNILPFRYAIDITRYSLNGNITDILKPLLILIGYIIFTYVITTFIFKKQMIKDNK